MRASKLPCVAQLHFGGGGGGGWVGTLDKQPQLKVGIMTPGQRWVWNLDGQTKLIKCHHCMASEKQQLITLPESAVWNVEIWNVLGVHCGPFSGHCRQRARPRKQTVV